MTGVVARVGVAPTTATLHVTPAVDIIVMFPAVWFGAMVPVVDAPG